MTPRALALAQKLEWFSGKQVQDVDLKEIEQELAAVRREAVEECAKIAEGLEYRCAYVLPSWEIKHYVCCDIAKDIRALNGPGTKGK